MGAGGPTAARLDPVGDRGVHQMHAARDRARAAALHPRPQGPYDPHRQATVDGSNRRRWRNMDWIERVFHLNLDAGSGAVEMLITVIAGLLLATALVRFGRIGGRAGAPRLRRWVRSARPGGRTGPTG